MVGGRRYTELYHFCSTEVPNEDAERDTPHCDSGVTSRHDTIDRDVEVQTFLEYSKRALD